MKFQFGLQGTYCWFIPQCVTASFPLRKPPPGHHTCTTLLEEAIKLGMCMTNETPVPLKGNHWP